MSPRFIDRFDVILLDLNGTFMFGHDRYGPEQDYHATYLRVGGSRLGREAVQEIITRCYREMTREYNTPELWEDYPSALESVRAHSGSDEDELVHLVAVISEHERGKVSPDYVAVLQEMAKTHALGIVSNLWADPKPWKAHLDAIGLSPAFTSMVFSSEGRTAKPSPTLFRQALAAFPADARVLFVGDSLERDIIPAKQLGMGTAWVAGEGAHPAADVTIPSVLDLPHVAGELAKIS